MNQKWVEAEHKVKAMLKFLKETVMEVGNFKSQLNNFILYLEDFNNTVEKKMTLNIEDLNNLKKKYQVKQILTFTT